MNHIFKSPIGWLEIESSGESITKISFSNKKPKKTSCTSTLLKDAERELTEYFKGRRKKFSIVLSTKGTPFQQSVWKAIKKIPYGKTVSYKDIAEKAGNPKACRAVGQACRKNPIAIMIPCHRVIGTDGKLAGYSSGPFRGLRGAAKKRWLINHETKP